MTPRFNPRFAAVFLAVAVLLLSAPAALAATSISQFGITWTFDRDYPTGQFANGDYWVVGPVKITSITPKSTTSSGVTKHGSMVNPLPNGVHAFDSRVKSNTFDASKNVARSFPFTLPAGSSLLSAESFGTTSSGNDPQLKTIAILTVLDRVPPAGSFRPPYAGTDKTIRWNKSNLDYSKLRSVAPVANTPSLSTVEAKFERPFIDIKSSWAGTYLQPKLNHPAYGREISHQVAEALLSLQLNYSQAQKEKLLVRVVQRGIDIYGLAKNGAKWNNDGGHRHGRKPVLLFAGTMLNHADMIAWADAKNKFIFQEDQQTWYISLYDVGRKLKTSDGRRRDPYTLDMVGLPEWGGRHTGEPEGDASQWDAHYRNVCGSSTIGTVLAMRMMGLQAKWNWPPLFDYMDRYFKVEASRIGTSTNLIQPFVGAMWKAYRNKAASFDEDNTSTAEIWQNQSFTAQKSAFTCTFEMVASQTKMEGVTGLSAGAADGLSDLAAAVRFAPSGFIEAANGATFQASTAIAYQAGVRYKVVISADPATDKYSVNVTPAGGATVKLATGYSFRSEQVSAAQLANLGFMSKTGAHSILNVGVTTTVVAAPAPAPDLEPEPTLTSLLRVNAGGAKFTDGAGRVWSADTGYGSGLTTSSTNAIANTTDDKLYQTNRYQKVSSSDRLKYYFDVTNGTYLVRLHFAETTYTAKGKRVFDVKSEGNLVIDNLDIFGRVGANKALVVEVPVKVADGRLSLNFDPVAGNPQVNAIEVLRTTTTTSTAQPAPAPTPTVEPTVKALLRVNAGGAKFTDGSGRVWSADTGFGSGITTSSTVGIDGTTDDKLYQSNRYQKATAGENLKYYFDVPNATYLVRLHFAETTYTAKGQRVFKVNSEGKTVIDNLDIFGRAGAKRALVIDVPVKVADGRLSLNFVPVKGNPQLNGIEVLPSSGTTAAAPTAPSPERKSIVRVNAGGSKYVGKSGRVWSADRGYGSGLTSSRATAIGRTDRDPLYQSRRYQTKGARENLKYYFNVPNAKYVVRLHFAETRYQARGKRVFRIKSEGKTIVDRLDIFDRAGANQALVLEVPVKVADGRLSLNFDPIVGNPQVNAIEVLADAS